MKYKTRTDSVYEDQYCTHSINLDQFVPELLLSTSTYEEIGNDYSMYYKTVMESRRDSFSPYYEEVDDIEQLPYSVSIEKLKIRISELQSDHYFIQVFKLLGKRANSRCNDSGLTTETGMDIVHSHKNRFPFIVPYDQTIVKLSENDSYINASYIPGYFYEREFIATQAPMEITAFDFWTMIIEKETNLIINLTKLEIDDEVRCFKYWPIKDRTLTLESIKVKTLDEKINGNLVLRSILLTRENELRRVIQMHYYAWPDKEEPDYSELSDFFDEYRELRKDSFKRPIVVHDCAGIGQTGSFILLNNLMEQLEAGNSQEIDIGGGILHLRNHRPLMINSPMQYLFLHKFLNFWLEKKRFIE